jgi:hypothetical protein
VGTAGVPPVPPPPILPSHAPFFTPQVEPPPAPTIADRTRSSKLAPPPMPPPQPPLTHGGEGSSVTPPAGLATPHLQPYPPRREQRVSSLCTSPPRLSRALASPVALITSSDGTSE